MGWLVARTDMPLRRTVRALVTASFVTPPFLGAIAWELLAAPNSGLLNKTWRVLTGMPQDEYLFNIYSLPGLIFVISCYTFPYVFVLMANALDRIPGDLEDASSILGGRTWSTARRITIPLVLPALLAGALVAFLQAMTLFGSPAILAIPAGFHTMTTKIWSLFNYPPKPELAAAASVPLLVVTVMLLRARASHPRPARLFGGRRQAGRSATGQARPAQLGGIGFRVHRAACARCSCRTARCSTPPSRKVATTFIWFDNFTLHNIHFVFFELSATKLAVQEYLHSGGLGRDARHAHGAGDRLSDHATRHHGPSHARLPRHRAGRDPRHRARRRPVPELRAAAASCSTARCGFC